MSVEFKWIIEGKVLREDWKGAITLEDILNSNQEAVSYFNSSTHRIHVIYDIHGVESAPFNVFRYISKMDTFQHPNQGWSIICTKNSVFRFTASVILQFYKGRFRFVETVDDALVFLRSVDDGVV